MAWQPRMRPIAYAARPWMVGRRFLYNLMPPTLVLTWTISAPDIVHGLQLYRPETGFYSAIPATARTVQPESSHQSLTNPHRPFAAAPVALRPSADTDLLF